jgi:HEAT repeat protein
MPLAEERIRAFARSIDDSRIRGAALVALGLLRTPSDVPTLVLGLSDEDVSDRAELGLRWFGHGAVPSLIAEGRRAQPSVRAATLSLVPFLTDRADVPTLDALREALHCGAPEVLTASIQAIALAGGGPDLCVLAPYATSHDARVAATACAALTSLAARHPTEARDLASTIPADSPAAIVGCLLRGASAGRGGSPPEAERATVEGADISFLRAALDHSDVRVRRAAVDALASIGGPTAADVVARALADEERDVVLAAVRALGRIGRSEPLVALLEGVNDPAVVAAALRALGEASPNRAFDAAWALLQSRDPLLASSAVETIGQLRGARRDDGLFIALEHPDPDVVKSALVELSHDMSPRTLARVGACLDCASYEIRRFAAELLGGADDPAADALIRARLDRETDPVVREALSLALTPRGARGGGA